MVYNTSVGKYLKVSPSGRNEALMVVIVGEFFKLHLFDDNKGIEEHEKQVRDNQVTF